MRTTLYAGAGLALTAGLLLGVAMRPQLALDDRPAGPQIFTAKAGARSATSFDPGMGFAGYPGVIPAYVTGTDAQTPLEAAAPEPAPERYAGETYSSESYYASPIRDEAPEPQAEARELTPAAYGVQTAEHVVYPSLDGGAAYDDASRAEKTPVVPSASREDEAPPEAAGDTSVQR